MFQNLIESGSHTEELARRSSFFIGTIGLYAVLFLVGGVLSIYAYDAHLENQQTEMVLVSFVPPAPPPTSAPANVSRNNNPPKAANNNSPTSTQPERRILMDATDNPRNVPKDVGTTASANLPAPSNAVLGTEDRNPVGGGPVRSSGGDGSDNGAPAAAVTNAREEVAREEPPKIVATPPKKKYITSTVLAGKMINKVVPPYTAIARAAHAQGAVVVEVLLDETGRVMSAHAVSGHPLLRQPAEQAARQTRFSPTFLSGEPVKVSGTITFNFVLN